MNATTPSPLWPRHERGIGIGGWLTNYKRFHVLPPAWRTRLTVGDFEHFASYVGERDIAYLAACGFDHVRLGFDQLVLEEPETPGRYREETLAHVDRFVEWCEAYGLAPVLNLHKAFGNYCDVRSAVDLFASAALQDRVVALWETLARRYAGRPDVAFEILNEVRDVPAETWNAFCARVLAALRPLAPGRKIVFGTTAWNGVWNLPKLRLFDDPDVVYTFHFYEPFAFTHQRGVLQASNCYYNRDMPYPCDDAERYRDFARTTGDAQTFPGRTRIDASFLADCLRPAADFRAAHPDKILWLGEFGTIRHARPAWREAWMRDVVAFCKAHGIPWCVWNYLSTPNDGNRFSLVDDDARRFLSPALLDACLGRG